MKFILGSLFGFTLGYFGHRTDNLIDGWENTPIAWKRLTRYGVGMILVGFTQVVIKHGLDMSKWENEIKDFIASVLPVGMGVFTAYMVDENYNYKGE